jgi:hypothetical protein
MKYRNTLLTFHLTAKKDKEIWVHHNDERVPLPENVLKLMRVSNVDALKRMIKAQFNISENIAIRSGSDNLEDSELVTGLYNTEDNALEVIVEENGILKFSHLST